MIAYSQNFDLLSSSEELRNFARACGSKVVLPMDAESYTWPQRFSAYFHHVDDSWRHAD